MDAQSQPDTSRLSPGESNDSSQAYPLSGYYSMIMDSQPHYKGQVSTARAASMREGKPSASMQEAKTPQEKMAIVFGTRLAGPGRQSRYNPGEMPPEAQWKTINGVAIPPRPEEPDNCCMSGCVHCVWDDFRDEMEDWAGRVALAKAKGGPLKGTADMRAAPRAEVGSASQSMDDDGGGSDANWSPLNEDEDLFGNIPVGIREFMKTEKKLRTKRQQAEAS
ncbi:hypothetical protein N7468_006403 [Penicillium chermesinum]|uniref:Oxidoreductase-like domain-containing protein n=1 Tax=Penicillium chermesinum TaxID=63820 RepID=A0A9W9NSM1_9EURO|nr:uncharacterized protein N7468_006403 [Penicillium chermesinum]KAJ5225178.1 hypothetical protein N7468_006403 [Penicillium chermesinum]